VSSLLALAIADGVLAGVEKPADLATLNYAEYSSKTEIAIKAGKEKIPVLRRCHAGGSGISPTAIMTADRLNEMCAELGERAGYKQKLGAYCMRRGFANKIDSKFQLFPCRPQLICLDRGTHYCRAKPLDGPYQLP
jgi:hypothetical protein